MVISKVNIIFLLFHVFLSLFLIVNAEEDVIYTASFTEEIKSCDGFENKFLIMDDLKADTNNGNACLKGKVTLTEDIPEGTEISINVWKVDGYVDEFLYTAAADFCTSVSKPESPWFTLFDSFSQTKCPIAANTYDVTDMSFNMDDYQEYMNSNNCGEYRMEMSLMNGPDKLSCHIVQAVVEEERQG